MKINKINFTTYLTKQSHTNGSMVTKPIHSQNTECLSAHYYQPVNFSGITQTNLSKELLSLKGVHCPICGVEMITKEIFESIIADVSKIKDSASLLKLLEKYKNNISKTFYPIVSLIKEKSINSPKASLEEILKDVHLHTIKEADTAFEGVMNFLNQELLSEEYIYAELLRLENIKRRMEDAKNDILLRYSISNLNGILRQELNQFSPESKKFLHNNITEVLKPYFFKENLFTYKTSPEDNFLETFCKNLFYGSKSDLRKAIIKDDAKPENLILTCHHCERNGNRLYQINNRENNNFFNYIYELAQHSLDGNLPTHPDYPIRLMDYVKKRTYNKLTPDFSNPTLKKLFQTLSIPQRHETVFPLANLNRQKCAYCGQETINHETKLIIQEKIANAENPREILQILKQNKSVIRPKYEIIVDYLDEFLADKPNATDAEIVNFLRAQVFEDIKTIILSGKQQVNLLKAKIKPTEDEIRLLTELDNAMKAFIKELSPNKFFDIEKFKNILDEYTNKLDTKLGIYCSIWKAYYDAIEPIYGTQYALFPPDIAVEKLQSATKVIAQNIIRRGQVVADHLATAAEYAALEQRVANIHDIKFAKTSENVVLACKECNQLKRSKGIKRFVRKDPERVRNFKKYLMKHRDNPYKIWASPEEYDINKIIDNFKTLTGIEIKLP